jgi:hypothetical protein
MRFVDLKRIEQVYAHPRCKRCDGRGFLPLETCECVSRAVFRIVLSRYWRAIETSRPTVRGMLLRCDFELAAARVLEPQELDVFRLHFLGRGDWHVCCRRLKVDRGRFYHSVYRAEAVLGRELLRRGIFPLWLYFDWGRQPIARAPFGVTESAMGSAA